MINIYEWFRSFLHLFFAAECVNPFTTRVSYGDISDSNFCVCGWNHMVWPFKWNLASSTFTWHYLYLSIFQNKIWDSSWILILGTLGSERVNKYSLPLFHYFGEFWAFCWSCWNASLSNVFNRRDLKLSVLQNFWNKRTKRENIAGNRRPFSAMQFWCDVRVALPCLFEVDLGFWPYSFSYFLAFAKVDNNWLVCWPSYYHIVALQVAVKVATIVYEHQGVAGFLERIYTVGLRSNDAGSNGFG